MRLEKLSGAGPAQGRYSIIKISKAILEGKEALAETRMRKHMRKTLGRLVVIGEDAFDQSY